MFFLELPLKPRVPVRLIDRAAAVPGRDHAAPQLPRRAQPGGLARTLRSLPLPVSLSPHPPVSIYIYIYTYIYMCICMYIYICI